MEKESHKHESFGQIYIGRTNGTANFYGSELQQDHYITLEVHHSEIQRELTADRYYASHTPLVLKLRMSSGQFSEMITNLNHGSGVPCTLEVIDGKRLAPLPQQESRKEFVHRKFEERMKMFADQIRENKEKAKQIVKKKTLSKDDVHALTHQLEWLTQEIEYNIPFFAKCFQENMDEVVFEAKTEVENAVQHKINTLGLTVLHEQNNLLNSEQKNDNTIK